jgi:hypothetical protein
MKRFGKALLGRARGRSPIPPGVRDDLQGGAARPYERAAYEHGVFGPFTDPADRRAQAEADRHKPKWAHHIGGPWDVRGLGAYQLLTRIETGDYTYGQLWVSCIAVAASVNPEAQNHAEVAIFSVLGGVRSLEIEGACAQRADAPASLSTGPLGVWLLHDEMPDSVEVWARALTGGLAQSAVNAAEVLTVSMVGRFRR